MNQILTIKQNNQLLLRPMLKQYAFKAFMSFCDAWERFLVITGRIQSKEL